MNIKNEYNLKYSMIYIWCIWYIFEISIMRKDCLQYESTTNTGKIKEEKMHIISYVKCNYNINV